MTDLIANVQEVYKKWESRSVSNRGRFKYDSSNRFHGRRPVQNESGTCSINNIQAKRYRNYKRPAHHIIPKYDGLAGFKMAPTVMSLHKSRPFVGIPCEKCVPQSRARIEDSTVYLLGVYNILHIPYLTLKTFNVCCFWNTFKVRNPFLSHDKCVDRLLKSERIQEIVQEIIMENENNQTDDAINELHQKCKVIVHDFKTSISSILLEITSFCLHYVLKKTFSGIFVQKGQLEILKILSQGDIPYVFLPLYRSYFDFIIIPYVLHRNSIKIPYTVVTDELNFPFLSYIFKYLGAIFVKNAFWKRHEDILYHTLVQNYLVQCLEDGHNIQLFFEKQRSLTGKPNLPDPNLLSTIVNSVLQGSIEDVYIVPLTTTYETVGEIFTAEQLGGSCKETNLFSKLYSFWKILHVKHSNVKINFNQPFSVREFIKNSKQGVLGYNVTDSPLSDSSTQIDSSATNIHYLVKDLVFHSVYDVTTSTTLMCTHLLAFLFITQYRKGGTQQQLQNSMDWLRSELIQKKSDVGFSGESLPAIKRAVELLGKDLISSETIEMEWTSSDLENNNVKVKIYNPVVKLPYVLELQYYANAVVPFFLRESILVNALYALVDVDICHFHHCDSRFYVSRDLLVETSIKLSNFLKYEFITIPPCKDIVSSFNDVIDQLIDKECLSTVGVGGDFYTRSKAKSHALSFDISDDEQCVEEIQEQLKIDLKEETICYLEFLRNILSPYIESYWLAACSLLGLIDEIKEESIFIQEMQMTAQEKLYKGLLAYEESFSANILRNSLKMFHDRQIIEYDYEDNIKTIYLSELYNSFESVNDIIADIEDFRK